MPRVILLLLLVGLALPGRADAAGCQAPAGTGAVDQYCETIPDEKGDQGANGPGAKDRAGGSPISDATATALARRGKDGEALARVLGKDPATLTGSRKAPRAGRSGQARPGAARGSVTPDVPSSNPLSAVTRAVSGDATIGSPFFLALFAVVLLVLGSAWVGWRRRSS